MGLSGVAEDIDIVVVALAHLLSVDSRNDFGCGLNSRLGQLENFAVCLIHLRRQIARDLDMLFLIFPYRHNVAVVNQNVGRH